LPSIDGKFPREKAMSDWLGTLIALNNGSIAMTKIKPSFTRGASQDEIVAHVCDLFGQEITSKDLGIANLSILTGYSKIRIKSLLDRRQNPRIRDLVRIAHALNGKLSIHFHPM
jgi:hypothetical protein